MRQNKKSKNKAILSWFSLAVFISVSIFFTILTSTTGAKFAELAEVKKRLTEENQILKSEIIRLSSLISLEENAYNDGFIKPLKVIYINEDEFVAKAQ